MGIPSYFSYLVRNHPSLLRNLRTSAAVASRPCANLYLDCNSLVYEAVHQLDFATLQEDEADAILRLVCSKIEAHIRLLNPRQNVFIAFDGVAPVAKLEQQRGRRYKSVYTQQYVASRSGEKVSAGKDPFNTAAITPGTRFMQRLNETMYRVFADPAVYGLQRLLVSGSNEHGEGEHKLFAYIRDHPEEHASSVGDTVIYGLDADLIMLSLNHLPVCSSLYLYRETPHFIQSINVELEPNESYLLDIPALAATIVDTLFVPRKKGEVDQVPPEDRLHDYIFLCFFLGNDFLPHFPAINIRNGGIDKLMQAYRATMTAETSLTTGRQAEIQWRYLRVFIAFLAQNEEQWIKEEKKKRDRRLPHDPDAAADPAKRLEMLPMLQRDTEHFINPFQRGWQSRYYRSLFQMVDFDVERSRQVCSNYLQGLEWTMRYYTQGCCDYRWKYNYLYPPLLEDLLKQTPFFDVEYFPDGEKRGEPINELVQLCYVLPKASLHLLPAAVRDKLRPEWHRDDCAFVWAFCRYFWESHVDLPHIDLSELELAVNGSEGV